jgi:hypothetical protein
MRSRLVTLLQAAVVAAAILLAIVRFFAIDAGSHSASDTLRPWLLETALIAVAATLVVFAIGRLTTAYR